MSEQFFALKADLGELVGDQRLVTSAIGPGGEACLLTVRAEDESVALATVKTQGGSFPLSRGTHQYAATFIRYRDRLLQCTKLDGLEQTFPFVQPLPNGEILLVGARCSFRDGDPEKNAVIFDGNGKPMREFVAGDGIEDVQTTRNGMIWVSYFDEGVFGNFGWTANGPIGAPGIVCFDPQGRKVWDFEAPPDAIQWRIVTQ